MGQIQVVVEKLRNGSRTKSILEDLGKSRKLYEFNEESSRIVHEMGNIELYELGQMTRTVQCHSCWKHLPEGLAFCSCGVCLRPDEATIKRIKVRFQALTVPYYLSRINRSRGEKHGETQWQQDYWKAMDDRRGAKKHDKDTITIKWQKDEKYWKILSEKW